MPVNSKIRQCKTYPMITHWRRLHTVRSLSADEFTHTKHAYFTR